MSHTASVKTVPIKSASALSAAVRALQTKGINCALETGVVPRMYFIKQLEQQMQRGKDSANYVFNPAGADVCDFVLRLPDAYFDVGFLKKTDGSYEPVFDPYPRKGPGSLGYGTKSVKEVLGCRGSQSGIGQLLREYTLAAVREDATMQGMHEAECSMDAEGNIQLVLQKY